MVRPTIEVTAVGNITAIAIFIMIKIIKLITNFNYCHKINYNILIHLNPSMSIASAQI